MSSRERLDDYLHTLLGRLRAMFLLRAAAIWALGGVTIVLLAVWLLRKQDYAPSIAMSGRIALLVLTLAVCATLIYLPLRRLRRHPEREIERRLPRQQGRIQTFLDERRRGRADGAMTELLARDALAQVHAPPDRVVADSKLWTAAIAAAAGIGALLFLLVSGPAYWGYASRHLLLGSALPRDAVPLREVKVKPGNVTVRRNSDLTIQAAVSGFEPEGAEIWVRFNGATQWERAPMQIVDQDAHTWQFKLFAVRDALEYYVVAVSSRVQQTSAHHNVAVVDLPRIERVRLTYRYPQWTALPDHIEDVSRRIRAVQGTRVDVEVVADAPLQAPVIAVGENTTQMQTDGTSAAGTIELRAPGTYRISSKVADEWVALTDDYPIEIVEDTKPSVEIRRPGRDWQASSIEEVPVSVRAQDDFKLEQLALRYSVNGGEWRTVALDSGAREADVQSLLRLEEMKASTDEGHSLQPGDLVSYYAVAKDRQHSVQTDLFMVQIQPFERRFSEGQGGGGGGSMGDQQGAISERQREILLATWNLLRSQQNASRSRGQLEESAGMLSELQTKLAAQARALSQRMRARTSVEDDARIAQFVESLEQAATVMGPAADHLKQAKLQPAVPMEQQALQHLLRAEAAFRDVQVAMQSGSGSGGQQAERNFTEMFELEMDVDKNHYETQSPVSERSARNELDETLRKLKELAERQERLAQQMQQSSMSREEQRWRQEQLRREAEDLQRRLAQQQQQQQQQNGRQGSASSQSHSGQSQQSGQSQEDSQSGAGRSGDSQATQSMQAALENMRKANESAGDNPQNLQRSAAEAGRNLREALANVDRPREESLAQQAEQLAQRASKLSEQQQHVEAELYQALGQAMNSVRDRGQLNVKQAQRLIDAKQQMATDLGKVQQEMRAAINDHRGRSPAATKKLAQALSELEDSNLSARLNRSAAEIRYGRARDAAPREGLIAEALQGLEENLRATAKLAAGESQQDQGNEGSEQMLARLAQLRSALEQQRAGQSKGGNSQGSKEQPSDASANESQGGRASLAQWTPRRSSATDQRSPAFGLDDAQNLTTQIDDLADRGARMGLTPQQIEALRRLTHQVRQIGSSATARLSALSMIDRMELDALNSVERSKDGTSSRASVAPDDSAAPEVLAEYFRRLGKSCVKGEGNAC